MKIRVGFVGLVDKGVSLVWPQFSQLQGMGQWEGGVVGVWREMNGVEWTEEEKRN